MTIVKQCKCGRRFTAPEWLALSYVGRMGEDEDEVALRMCPCGSSIALLAVYDELMRVQAVTAARRT